jgi:hypothetical protein
MKVNVKQTVELDDDSFDEVLAAYFKYRVEEDSEYIPAYVIFCMKVVHDWFSMPSDWYFSLEKQKQMCKEYEQTTGEQ